MTAPEQTARELADATVRAALDAQRLTYERPEPGSYLVRLEGTARLATMTWLVVNEQSLLVAAFFVRRPEENTGAVYRFLLSRNARMYGVAFSVDSLGDVYLSGRLPLTAVSEDEIDRLLGCVLTYSDENFNRVLELGFGSSIRKEWRWRQARGESTANLSAFGHFADPCQSERASTDVPRSNPASTDVARTNPAATDRS